MTNGQFDAYLSSVRYRLQAFPTERLGQAYFNELSMLHPNLAETYRSTALDPFYMNDRVAAFLFDLYSNHVR